MASCLYECLCEAELEKYYPHFIALGFQKIDELAKVSMKDYARLGVHNMKDRKRLFQLIRIIKILQAEEEAVEKNKQRFQAGGLYCQPRVTRSGPRRQLHFESLSEEKGGGNDPEAGLCALSTCSVNEDKDDLAAVLGHDSEHKQARRDTLSVSAAWTEYKLDIPAISSSSDIAPLLGGADTPIVQRVAHLSGYNYGVPHSCFRPNASEKETPWTETDKIRVCVRKRPLGLREGRRGEVNIITVEDKETLLLHEKKEAVDLTQYILQHVFYFDEVFGEACSNHDVYMKTAHPLIQHIFNGGNATCFAYGQTGAGKTYTMIGTHQNPGLYALAAKDIFRQLETSPTRKDLHVWISFYEIYCGQLYDLLNGRKRLFAREDSKRVVQIVGLREVQVDTVSLLLEVILKGGKERSTGATGVNSDSSRSHAIIQIQIKDPANRVFGRISFIDLAGSERAADARDSDRQTKMEGAEINQSLLALKECIRALDQEQAHTPFRQSKLTQVLKDSFVGNSKTCMIANVSPSHIATEHTLNTLRYADRVKELKKGMKCCQPSARNKCATGSLSPKRIQSSPGMQAGEKNSPKKVKLGLPHPPTPTASARMKASPFLFHPGHSPFSSTPKAQARKGHPGTPMLSHHSPVKGALRAKKTTEDPALLSEKSHFGKDPATRTASSAEARRENGQGDRQQGRCLKVQPVRKQLLSRGDFSAGDADCPSAQVEEGKRAFAEQCAVAWTSLPPHQKDREQHLRLYHQQFQQPPILHQKLNYQPLEEFLARYKPREIQVKQEFPCEPPQCQEETMQLEDLDDSDFSEDSFSPGPSRRKPETEAARECSQASFFLHQREPWPEGEGGQKRIFRQPTLMPPSGAVLRTEEAAGCEEASQSPPAWSSEETAAPGNDMPEKPFCSQGDSVMCSQMSSQKYLVKQKQPIFAGLYLGCSDERCFLPEKTPSSPPSAHILASARCAGSDQKEVLVKGKHALHSENTGKKQLHTGEDLCEAMAFSLDVVGGLVMPLSVSLLGSETSVVPKEELSCQRQEKAQEEKERVGKKSLSPQNQLNEDTTQFLGSGAYEMDHCGKQVAQVLSPPAKTMSSSQSCCTPKVHSSLGGALSLRASHDCICGLSAGDAGLEDTFSMYGENESALLLSDLQGSECVAGPHYDTDTEATMIAPLSCSGQFSLDEEDGTKPMTQIKSIGMQEKSFVSNASSISCGTENMEFSGECSPLQPSLEFRKLELGQAQEACKFIFNSEDTGLIKNKFIQSALTHNPTDAARQDSQIASSGINTRSPKNSLNGCGQLDASKVSHQCKETLGRQFILQIRQELLDEMAALCSQEESLISRMSDLDFEGLVVKLDEMLMLKSRCIQRMRTQLQPFLATQNWMALQRLSPT